MATEKVADARNRRAQRAGVTYGNMRAKLSDYIGQVFECKADRPHYSHTVVRAKREERDSRDVQTQLLCVSPFPQVSPASPEQGIRTCSRHLPNRADEARPREHLTSPVSACIP